MNIVQKYKPSVIHTQNWLNIEAFYIDLILNHNWPLQEMLELVRYIQTKMYSDRLYAYTSLDSLIISIYDMVEPHRETLKIDYNRQLNLWKFEYHALPYQDPEFVRQYPDGLLIEKFISFINYIKW